MHIEILVEDSSGAKLLSILVPKIIGEHSHPHTWNIHQYKGIGRVPTGLTPTSDPQKRILLDQLPRILSGYGKTAYIDAVIVVLDSDKRDCASFLTELKNLARVHQAPPSTIFRLAIEEMEAWYLGDQKALQRAFPRLKMQSLKKYKQDSVCGTWELLADAVYPGGSSKIKKEGWPLSGQLKHEWAEKIGPLLSLDGNKSPSFNKLCEGLRGLVGHASVSSSDHVM